MTHEDIHADLPSFALGALDPSERREIAHHLASGCSDCQRELAIWQEVVGALALAEPEAAPPHLKPALLTRLYPRRARVIRLPRSALVPLAAAALALLAVGIVREARWRTDLDRERTLVADLHTQMRTTQENLQRLTAELTAKENDVTALRAALAATQESLAVLQAPGLQLVQLREAPKAQPGEGHVLISRESGRALFYAFDLPAVPSDKAYELWWITEKQGPVNAGVFRPDQRGLGRVDTRVPSEAGALQAAAVTIEPARGVSKPTGPMVLLGKVPAAS